MTAHTRIPLPADVVEYISQIFQNIDKNVSSRLDRMPTLHEEHLDLSFIETVTSVQGPHITPSGTVVDIDVHFVGSGRHWRVWEIADIGFIVNFRRGSELLRTKIVLLQSKRIYPRETEFVEVEGMSHTGGFGSLMRPSPLIGQGPRAFQTDETCVYKALHVGNEQWSAIVQYEEAFKIPVHYMLYHPSNLPAQAMIPVTVPIKISDAPITVGTRIISSNNVRNRCADFPVDHTPSFIELSDAMGAVGASLTDFVVSGVLSCTEGYITDDWENDSGVWRVFNARNAPIWAAIRMDIHLP
ncbi:hypothetical protein AB0I30_19030 [Nocardia tengchongensis]|uniref:hypothetical protein n=1 Tax=Nocardia tengchongensis TaxID=2055889 RepID=UPI0034084DA5